MKAFHFTSDTLRNGELIPARGRWFTHSGHIKPCDSGLHASAHPMDALQFAPGPILHYVELDGELVSHGDPVDKWVGRRRKIIASIDTTELLWAYSRHCALSVAHLWDAPEVVLEFLFTGREKIRAAARDAARAAAWDAARDAAWAAARDAAWAAAWAAAWDAARDAAWAAARDAAWAAARAAAWDAARDANKQMFLDLVIESFAEYGTKIQLNSI